jgi:hypothetical protein
MHRFETLSFAPPTGRPPVLVVGNSGIAEDTGPPAGAFAQIVDGAPASGFSVSQFGYLELTRDRDGKGPWHGSIVALDPAAWSPFLAPCAAPDGVDPALCVKPAGDRRSQVQP